MTSLTVPVPGGRLHVVDEGDPAGPAILLLHAGIADLTSWDALAPRLVAAGHRVVRYDARGFGRSVTDDVAYSNRADSIAVLDALSIRRAALLGNSRGGQIAFDIAIEYPDRVLAVIGVGAGLGRFEGDPTPDEIAAFERMDALEERLDAAVGPATPRRSRRSTPWSISTSASGWTARASPTTAYLLRSGITCDAWISPTTIRRGPRVDPSR